LFSSATVGATPAQPWLAWFAQVSVWSALAPVGHTGTPFFKMQMPVPFGDPYK
jgi:hypothetical protein